MIPRLTGHRLPSYAPTLSLLRKDAGADVLLSLDGRLFADDPLIPVIVRDRPGLSAAPTGLSAWLGQAPAAPAPNLALGDRLSLLPPLPTSARVAAAPMEAAQARLGLPERFVLIVAEASAEVAAAVKAFADHPGGAPVAAAQGVLADGLPSVLRVRPMIGQWPALIASASACLTDDAGGALALDAAAAGVPVVDAGRLSAEAAAAALEDALSDRAPPAPALAARPSARDYGQAFVAFCKDLIEN